MGKLFCLWKQILSTLLRIKDRSMGWVVTLKLEGLLGVWLIIETQSCYEVSGEIWVKNNMKNGAIENVPSTAWPKLSCDAQG